MMWLSILILFSAIAHIFVDTMGWKKACFVTKPLTMVLIIALLFAHADFYTQPLHGVIFVGLLCSLGGDLFLLFPEKKFISGLICFLGAHVFYAFVFWRFAQTQLSLLPLVLVLPIALVYMGLLWNELGSFRLPVLVYTGMIVFMGICAGSWYLVAPGTASAYALGGASLFIVSDACLAWRKFKGNYALSPLWVMGTYFGAQWLIVLSMR